MRFLILSARKFKGYFLKLRLHGLLSWITGPALSLFYLSRLSAWVRQTPRPELNDFYVPDRNYERRYRLYDHLLKNHAQASFNYLEFGVARGVSFRWWLSNVPEPTCRFFGFDTFTGLPEDWTLFKAGDMSADGSFPDVGGDQRAVFLKGTFQETLPGFLDSFADDRQKILHLDADIYTSTLFVLTQFGTRLRKGDVLLFDEFNVPMHEFRAFLDFTSSYYIRLRLVAAVNNYYQAAFIVEETPYQP